jgi:hypothetical protein
MKLPEVEAMIAPKFKISTYCGGGECVAVAVLDDKIAVRDDKMPDGPLLIFTADEWDAFLAGVKDGQFDRQTLARASAV